MNNLFPATMLFTLLVFGLTDVPLGEVKGHLAEQHQWV